MTYRQAERAEKILRKTGHSARAVEVRSAGSGRSTWQVMTEAGIVQTPLQAEKLAWGDRPVFLAQS